MREYKQLTEEQRIEIYAMKQAGKEQNIIAAELGVHPSTVSRELTRNTGLRGYRPKQAQQKTLYRRFTAVLLKNSNLFNFNSLCKLSESLPRFNSIPIFGRNQY